MSTNQYDARTLEAARNMDWEQVVCNGGPPCFFIEGPQFCGRAERWEGHGNSAFHDYVSLEALLVRALAASVAADVPAEDLTDQELSDRVRFHKAEAVRFGSEGAKMWRFRLRTNNATEEDLQILAALNTRRAAAPSSPPSGATRDVWLRAIEIVGSFEVLHEEISKDAELIFNARVREIVAALTAEMDKPTDGKEEK